MQRPRTRGVTAAGETKRWATQQSPRHQTAMMVRHFTVGHCADAPIPALGRDSSTLAAPLNASSSTPSALHSLPPVLLPPKTPSLSHGSLYILRRCRIFELGGEAPRAPPGQQEQAKSPRPLGAWSRRPPAHWGADVGRGEPHHPGDLHGLDPMGSCTRRCSERIIAAGGGDAGSPPGEEYRPGAPGGRGHPRLPPPRLRTPLCHRSWHPLRPEWS
jgi:hypothetical protein